MKSPDELFTEHFTNNTTREKRSDAYKWGVVDALNFKIKGVKLSVPFAEGTADRDAYFAGHQEGFHLYSSEPK